jgi:cold shock CspA family protein
MYGKIKKYDRERAFGWIEIEDQVKLTFFHISQWESKNVPVVGQDVQFVEGADRNGRSQAQSVRPIELVTLAQTAQTEGRSGGTL